MTLKNINLSAERMRALDPGNMLGMTLELPDQIRKGMDIGAGFLCQHSLDKIDYVDWMGLGGSAVAGDLLQAFGCVPPALPLRIDVRRHSHDSTAKRLVCSYSGNTVESVYALESVPASQVWFSMSSGGNLASLAQSSGIPHLMIPGGYPPRASVGFVIGAMLSIFEKRYGYQLDSPIESILRSLTEDAEQYRQFSAEQNPALDLARKLVDKTPVIYTTDPAMSAIAFRFRAQLAENSKVWSHSADLPELAHNEVEAFHFLGQVLPPPLVIFLGKWNPQGQFTDPRPGIREILDSLPAQHITLDPVALWDTGIGKMTAGLRLMLLLDSISIYLAVLKAIDPLEIPVITKLKKLTSHA
ncbi:hypothetical protein EHM69_03930 [candidate division KSB1 bacterium]|nr:MAG: hypothetical protein EHM69_03930 [candidate division KSB1 bacterium]